MVRGVSALERDIEMNDNEPEIKPAMSNEELQTAINAIILANLPELVEALEDMVFEQARRAKLWTAKESK